MKDVVRYRHALLLAAQHMHYLKRYRGMSDIGDEKWEELLAAMYSVGAPQVCREECSECGVVFHHFKGIGVDAPMRGALGNIACADCLGPVLLTRSAAGIGVVGDAYHTDLAARFGVPGKMLS